MKRPRILRLAHLNPWEHEVDKVIWRQVAAQACQPKARLSSRISSPSPQIEGAVMHISATSLVPNAGGAQYGPWYRESRLSRII
jgi:hypothetical protein